MNKKSVFDILDLEDGDASVLLAQARILKDSGWAKYKRTHFCRRKYSEYNAEHNSICPSCEKKRDFLRIVFDHDELMCYDCFFEGCQIDAEFSSYHGGPVEEVDGFMYDDEWEELWAEENPHMIYDEEDEKYYDKNIPRRKKTKEEIAYKKATVKRVMETVPEIMEAFQVFEKQLGI